MRTTLRSVAILHRAGLVDLTRPRVLVRSARATRSLGPIAGAAVIGVERAPDQAALVDELGEVTYRELDARTDAVAAAWAAGERPPTTVGVLCRDHRGAVEAMVAAGKVGARLVLLNTSFAGPQLADVVAREGVGLLVLDEEFAPLLTGVGPAVDRVFAWHDRDADELGWPVLEAQAEAFAGRSVRRPRSQGGLVLLTGGTTGTPKGAPRQVRSPLAAAQFLDRIPQRRGEVVCIAAPTFHGTGLSQFIMALALSSTIILRRRFDAEATLAAIARHRADTLVAVPTMLQRILALGAGTLARYDTSSLRIVVSAGAPLTADLGNRFTAEFGPVIHNFYGCTEVAMATVATPEDWRAAPGTVGRPPVGVTVRLYDDRGRAISSPGVSGSVYVGNGLAFQGYSGGGSKPVLDGLMGTGDTGHWDGAGRLFIDGRDDDMIVSGGENVFPAEIESAVHDLPGVLAVATTPVPDQEFGTRLHLFVVREADQPDEAAIRDHVRTTLARYKVPRDVTFVDAIPHTPTGKVDRVALASLPRTSPAH